MWEKVKGLGWHRKLHWLIVYGVLCVVEFVVHKAKEHVELKFKPKEDDDEDDEDEDEPARKKKRR
jgi:hypothetical protein